MGNIYVPVIRTGSLTTSCPLKCRPFYVFDFIPIALAFAFYSVPALHFGRCLNSLQVQCAGQGVNANNDEAVTADMQAVVSHTIEVNPRSQEMK